MSGSMKPSLRRPAASSLRSKTAGDGDGQAGGGAPAAPQPALPAGLPAFLRALLPFGPAITGGGPATPAEQKGRISWQDVCFVHSIPGDDNAEGLVVLGDGTLRKFIAVKGVSASLLDEASRDRLGQQLGSFVDSSQTDIQIFVRTLNRPVDEYLSRCETPVKTDVDFLRWHAENTDKWFRRVQEVNFVPQPEFYVVVGYDPPDVKGRKQPWAGRRSIQKHEEYLDTLNSRVLAAMDALRQAGLRPEIVTRRQVRNLIYAALNPTLSQKEPLAPPSQPGQAEASALARAGLKVSEEHVLIDGKYVGTQYLAEPPPEPKLGWLTDLMAATVEFTLSVFIHAQESASAARRQQPGPAAPARNPFARSAFARSSGKKFDVSLYVSTHADTPERLSQQMDQIRRAFRGADALLDRGQMLQLECWQSALPVGVDRLAVVHEVPIEEVVSFCPLFSSSCGTPQGVPFGLSLGARAPVLFDPYFKGQGKDNSNIFLAGSRGAAHSLISCVSILRLLPSGVRFLVLDSGAAQGNPYRFLAEVLGPEHSSYLCFSAAGGLIANPFDPGPDDKPAEPSADKLAGLLALFQIMLAQDGDADFSAQERALLEGLIKLAYMDASFRNTVPTMSDLARITLKAAADEMDPMQRDYLQRLARGLAAYTRAGSFGWLVDGYTNVDTEKPLVVIEARDLNDSRLERLAMYMAGELIKRKFAESKARGIRIGGVIDEAAALARFRAGATLLDDLARRARQGSAMLLLGTRQLPEFFHAADSAGAAARGAHVRFILRQDADDLKLLKDGLKLGNAELVALERLAQEEPRRRELPLMLAVGDVHGLVGLLVSPMEYWICTAEPKDLPRRMEMIQAIKAKNPALNHTDACRQAVFQLGQSAE